METTFPAEIGAALGGAPKLTYANLHLRVAVPPSGSGFTVELEHANETTSETVTDVSREVLVEHVRALRRMYLVSQRAAIATRELTRVDPIDPSSRLREMGTEIFEQILPLKRRERVTALLQGGSNLRIFGEIDADLAHLPWECLYVPPLKLPFCGLSRRFSLVRYSQRPGRQDAARRWRHLSASW